MVREDERRPTSRKLSRRSYSRSPSSPQRSKRRRTDDSRSPSARHRHTYNRHRHRPSRSRSSSPRKRRHSHERHTSSRHHPQHLQDEPPALYSIQRGKVQSVRPFGVFVALDGYQRHGMVHNSQVSDELLLSREDEDDDKVKAMEYFCPPGSQVWVKVTEVSQDDGSGRFKIALSMKAVDQEDGKDLDPENLAGSRRGGMHGGPNNGVGSAEPPELGSVHRATVASLRPFGAFVRLQGYQANGLVHVSQISDHMDMDRDDSDEAKTAAIGQVLALGEQVWVKVVDVKEDPGGKFSHKIGVSIKLVDQRDGTDHDPHGLKYKPRRGDEGGFGARRPVGADVGQVQQGGGVDWGHLKAGDINFDQAAGRGYELVGAEVEELAQGPAGTAGNGSELPPPPPMGRGHEMTKPAWMKDQPAQAGGITTVEEALAVLDKYKKQKKVKKEKKVKKSKSKKDKKERKRKDKR